MPSFKENIQEKKIIQLLKTQEWRSWHPKSVLPHDIDTNNEDALFKHFVECIEKNNHVKFDKLQQKYLKQKIEAIRDDGQTFNVHKVFDFLFNSQTIKGDEKEDIITIIDWRDVNNNIFEVSDQLWFHKDFDGEFKYRKDLFLLINGIPIVSIEEKKFDKSLKNAFVQTIKYRNSWVSEHTILNLCILHVITNEEVSMLFGATDNLNYSTWNDNSDDQKNNKALFHWADSSNNRINKIYELIKTFFIPSHLLKYLSEYAKPDKKNNTVFYAKPHQFHANEIILEHFANNWKSPGYVWHATASGKTFTMYMAWNNFSEKLIADYSILLVDRVDLDTQTTKKFKVWEQGVKSTGTDIAIRSKNKLINAIKKCEKKIVVTIDIFNNLISDKYDTYDPIESQIPWFKNSKVAIMFDECHRSLFGKKFKNIKQYFSNAALLGFTGTPIFKDNSLDFNNITPELFPTQLHKYGLGQALNDGIVLPVDYENVDLKRIIDINENDTKTLELDDKEKKQIWKTKKYYEHLVDDVVSKLQSKTLNFFYAMLAVSSIDAANLVYEIFKGVQNSETKEIKPGKYPNVNVVADFSTNENELIEETNDDVFVKKCDKKAFKRRVIADFNDITGEMIDGNDEAQFSRSLIDNLENNPAYSKNLKGPIQIVIVVDKMLTGFNSDYVNCLFLDKSITSYRLIQATSRTTRVSTEEKKKVGFLIAYRISEKEIEESFSEYSGDKKIKLTELVNNYVNRINEIKECVNIIKAIVPLPIDMDKPEFYENENKLSEFIKHFRILKTLIDIFQRYDEYKWNDINITIEEYGEYLSKYINLPKNTNKQEEQGQDKTFDFKLEIVFSGHIDSKKIWELIKKVKTKDNWYKESRPNIINIISDSVLSHFKYELLKFLDNDVSSNNYNILDIRGFKIRFKSFLETLSDIFYQLANKIKKEYKIDLNNDQIKNIYTQYKFKPKDSDWIETLISTTGLENANKLYDFFFLTFKTFLDKSNQIKKIVDQVAHEI